MNVKQWALFFLVTLSVNYVSATFLPVGGSRRRSSYRDCNSRLHGFLSSKVDGLRESFLSKYGRQCSLGNRELDQYTLRNVRAKGLGNFGLGDRCQYYVNDGRAFLSFALSFEEIVASFIIDIEEAIGGIFGSFVEAIFGIIGHFANKFLHIGFPSFLCNIDVTGDRENGFSLSGFRFLKPQGNIGFLGGLAGHGDELGSFSRFLFEPLEFCISLFLTNNFRPFLESGIGDWEYDDDLFSSLGLGLGGNSGRGLGLGGGSEEGELEDGESDDGDLGLGGITGGSRHRGKTGGHGLRGITGGSRHGRKTGGRSELDGITGGLEDGELGLGGITGGSRHRGKTGGQGLRGITGGSRRGRKSGGRSGLDGITGGRSGLDGITGGRSGLDGITGGSRHGGKTTGSRHRGLTGGSRLGGKYGGSRSDGEWEDGESGRGGGSENSEDGESELGGGGYYSREWSESYGYGDGDEDEDDY